MKEIQLILMKLRQWFFCWHRWEKLTHHGLPNEPHLSMCYKCRHIAKTLI